MEDNNVLWNKILDSEFDLNFINDLNKKLGFLCLLVHDEKGFSIIHWASILGLNDLVEYLLNKGVPVDLKARINEEPSAIHLAALEGNLNVIDTLIKYGADINEVDKKGCTPLMRAAMFGYNIDTTTSDTILHLISRGANPDLKDNIGYTALHYATFKCREDAVSLLITIGLDTNVRDKDGFKPLDIALHFKNAYIINELAEYTIEAQNGRMDSIIEKYSKKRFNDYFDLLLIISSRFLVLFFLFTTLFWTYPQYVFYYYPVSKDLIFLHLTIFISSSLLWVFWYRVMKKNPGYLELDTENYYELLEDKLIVKDSLRKKYNKNDKLCNICRTIQPLRSKHCRFCNRCIDHYDYHCLYLNNCIGKNNRLSFFCLIFHLLLVGILYFILILIVIKRNNWKFKIEHIANLIFCLKLIFLGGLLTTCTIKRAVLNLTKNEQLKREKYLKTKNGKFYNPFDKGFWLNLKEHFTINAFFLNKNRFYSKNKYIYEKLNS